MINHQWQENLSDNEAVFALIVAVVTVLTLFSLIFYYLKRARLIEDTPTSRIRSATQGYVELIGAVSASEAGEQIAPLSGIPCVWFDYKVERYQQGKNGHWYTIDHGTSTQWFKVDDKTGACMIDPKGAEVISEHKRVWYGNTERPEQQRKEENQFLRGLSGRRYRYTERFIYIHDIIYAIGNFKSVGGGRNVPSNHDMTGEVIREWKKDYNWILENFDKEGNGEIDMQEWEKVREAASQEADKRRIDLSSMPTIHMLIKPSSRRQPFIISNRSQKSLAKQFRIYAMLAFAGTLISIYFIVALTI